MRKMLPWALHYSERARHPAPVDHRMARKGKPKRRAARFRVRELMAENNIRSVTELSRRLDEIGVSITHSALGRMIDNATGHWPRDVLEGLMSVFDCEMGDLWSSDANSRT